ncbi:MAG: gluconate 2-dehydrogenase subunit 3 family protein [Deltaproteobacteria bacterium]|nr:gluconate 2-dehydrogenase subunit 3 family protein [Deltaproteobacteria bacterium]
MRTKLYRRSFTKLTVLTGASVLVVPACRDDAVTPPNELTLTSDERDLFERFAEVFLPTDGSSLKPRAEVPVVDNIEHAFTLMDAPTLEQVRIGLKLFDYGAVLIGLHFARFVHLSAERRLDYIKRWEDGLEIQRGISTVLKKLVCYGYWKDIEAGRAIGYQGPVSKAGGIASLGNAPMPSATNG